MTSIFYKERGGVVPVVPMLYSAFIALILLRAYTDTLTVYVLPVLLSTYAVFRFCGYCKRTNPRSYYTGLIAALVPIFCFAFFSSDDVPLVLWLFSPFPPAGHSAYFFIVLIFACFFVPSAVFYFTSVIYRAPVHLLLLIVSYVANYRKGVEVPAVYAALTAGLFFAVMLFSGNPELKDSAWRVRNRFIYAFAAAVVIAAGLASFINLPERELPIPEASGNSSIAALLGYSQSSGNAGFANPSNRILFLVEAEEPVYFIRQVFGNYSGLRWWLPEDDELGYGYYNWEETAASLNYDLLFDLIDRMDGPVAGREYISGLKNAEIIKSAAVFPQDAAARYILAPVRTFAVSGLPDGMQRVRNKLDEIFFDNGMRADLGYTVEYYSDIFSNNRDFQDFARQYDEEEWPALLIDLYLSAAYDDSGYAGMVLNFYNRDYEATQYAECTGGYRSEKLRKLTEEITAGHDSVFDKAKALERYFHQDGYTYDLAYGRENDDMEYFVFEGKTGICGHYATAMTLMARMAGLNARYVEGFVSTEQNKEGRYVIREANSHAFVQVYVPAYGWVTFDPTVAAARPSAFLRMAASVRDALNEHIQMIFAAVSVLIVLGCIGVLTYVFIIEELLFRRRAGRSGAGTVLIYRRVLRLAQKKLKTENLSAGMLSRMIDDAYGVDIAVIADCYERAVFNNESIAEEDKAAALAAYTRLRMVMRKLRPNADYAKIPS